MEKKCLVLNADYTPMTIETSLRAFVIICKGHAESVVNYPRQEYYLRSAKQEFEAPLIIRVNKYYKIPFRKVPLSKYNIFKRDGYKCQYCGSKNNLTLDHVIPRSKGGKDTWKNLVTACQECNQLKADNIIDPKDIKSMGIKPSQPHFLVMMQKAITVIPEEWKPYLYIK